MANKYQIREIRGLFYIFVEEEITTGVLWWKKKKKEWVRAADDGNTSMYAGAIRIYIRPRAPFETLEEAQERVRLLKKETVIHDCE